MMQQYIAVFLIWIFLAPFFEWMVHRFVMHRPLGGFNYLFQTHALLHHRIFKADHTYHLIQAGDKNAITTTWWCGIGWVLVAAVPSIPVVLAYDDSGFFLAAVAGASLYFYVSEYLHWCMHVPKQRRIEQTNWFKRLNGHHLLHHRYMHKNFNLVLPLADLLFGTLIKQATTRFSQPKNPVVPSVQPAGSRVMKSAGAR